MEVTRDLEDLLNKNSLTDQRLLRKRLDHTAQSIFLLCAQDLQERKRDELLNQAVNYDLPVLLDPRNQVNKGRSKWTGFDPTTGEYFKDPIELGVEVIELGVEVKWDDYQHLRVIQASSGAINLVQTFSNLVDQGLRNGLGN